MPSTLRERVAKAICGKGCDMPKCSIQPSANSRAVCRQMSRERADAAISLVLEEAAKVADANMLGDGQMLSGTRIAAVHDGACIEIAKAIRSLHPTPPTQEKG